MQSRREFQPMKANFGLLPELHPSVRGKAERYRAYADRALHALEAWIADGHAFLPAQPASPLPA